MASSPGFGSTPSDSSPYSDSISLRLPYSVNLATESNSLTHYTKGTQSPKPANQFYYAGSIALFFSDSLLIDNIVNCAAILENQHNTAQPSELVSRLYRLPL